MDDPGEREPTAHPVRAGLAALVDRFGALPHADGDARPVFVLSAGWRSGSTLLQRLLVSSGSLLVWGEPYDRSACIRSLAEMVAPFDSTWPPDRYVVNEADDVTDDQWIGNRYPHPHDLLGAQRAFLDRLFDEPARRLGFDRWGVKCVRLGGAHAAFLKAVYPNARIVFLVRNPYDAYLSYQLLHEARQRSYWWYYRWPEREVSGARQFGTVWRTLAESFADTAHELGALLVTYESLISGEGLGELSSFVEAEINGAVLGTSVGSWRERRRDREGVRAVATLTLEEQWDLREVVDPMARRMGYVRASEAIA